jgi:hypothetical protein
MSETHDFDERLQWSETQSDEPFWDAVYRKAFPNLVNHMLGSGDTESQRKGIDRVILLANGKTLYIDEKKRGKMYDDILLEFLSVDTKGTAGWIEKDLQIDYLAYAFMPNRRVYLLDWQMLRRAWIKNGEDWKKRFRIVKAQNKNYTTHSVAVPIKTLLVSLVTATIVEV